MTTSNYKLLSFPPSVVRGWLSLHGIRGERYTLTELNNVLMSCVGGRLVRYRRQRSTLGGFSEFFTVAVPVSEGGGV